MLKDRDQLLGLDVENDKDKLLQAVSALRQKIIQYKEDLRNQKEVDPSSLLDALNSLSEKFNLVLTQLTPEEIQAVLEQFKNSLLVFIIRNDVVALAAHELPTPGPQLLTTTLINSVNSLLSAIIQDKPNLSRQTLVPRITALCSMISSDLAKIASQGIPLRFELRSQTPEDVAVVVPEVAQAEETIKEETIEEIEYAYLGDSFEVIINSYPHVPFTTLAQEMLNSPEPPTFPMTITLRLPNVGIRRLVVEEEIFQQVIEKTKYIDVFLTEMNEPNIRFNREHVANLEQIIQSINRDALAAGFIELSIVTKKPETILIRLSNEKIARILLGLQPEKVKTESVVQPDLKQEKADEAIRIEINKIYKEYLARLKQGQIPTIQEQADIVELMTRKFSSEANRLEQLKEKLTQVERDSKERRLNELKGEITSFWADRSVQCFVTWLSDPAKDIWFDSIIENHYFILGVYPRAGISMITAYARQLKIKFHPDQAEKFRDQPDEYTQINSELNVIIRLITDAEDTLLDTDKRQLFDEQLENSIEVDRGVDPAKAKQDYYKKKGQLQTNQQSNDKQDGRPATREQESDISRQMLDAVRRVRGTFSKHSVTSPTMYKINDFFNGSEFTQQKKPTHKAFDITDIGGQPLSLDRWEACIEIIHLLLINTNQFSGQDLITAIPTFRKNGSERLFQVTLKFNWDPQSEVSLTREEERYSDVARVLNRLRNKTEYLSSSQVLEDIGMLVEYGLDEMEFFDFKGLDVINSYYVVQQEIFEAARTGKKFDSATIKERFPSGKVYRFIRKLTKELESTYEIISVIYSEDSTLQAIATAVSSLSKNTSLYNATGKLLNVGPVIESIRSMGESLKINSSTINGKSDRAEFQQVINTLPITLDIDVALYHRVSRSWRRLVGFPAGENFIKEGLSGVFLARFEHYQRQRDPNWKTKNNNPVLSRKFGGGIDRGGRPTQQDFGKRFPGVNKDEVLIEVGDGHAHTVETVDPRFFEIIEGEIPRVMVQEMRAGKGIEGSIASSLLDANNNADQREEYDGHGACMALVYITPREIIAANAGDAEIILSRGGTALMLSKTHNTDNPGEVARIALIREENVEHQSGRVTRAVGDRDVGIREVMTAMPHIQRESILAVDEFLIVATDGVLDGFADDQDKKTPAQNLIEFLHYCWFTRGFQEPNLLAKEVIEEVKRRYKKRNQRVNPEDKWILDNMKIEIVVFPDAIDLNYKERQKLKNETF